MATFLRSQLRGHNVLCSPVASLTPHTHPQWYMESIHRMVMAPILVVAALKYSLKSTYCPAKPASVNTLDHIVSQRGYSGIRGLWPEPPMHPSGPALQLLSVPQSKKPRVVTSTSSWCTRLITTTPRNYIGCNNLNKNPKRDSDTSPGWMGNLGASVAYATNLSFQSTLFAIRYGPMCLH